MSLNKLTSSGDYLQKQFLNVGCNDIKCKTLEVDGISLGKSGKYSAAMTCSIAGSAMLGGFVYYNVVGKQMTLSWSRLFTLGADAKAITFTIELPSGYTSPANTGMAGMAIANDDTYQLFCRQPYIDPSGTKIVVQVYGANNITAFPKLTYFSGNLTIELP